MSLLFSSICRITFSFQEAFLLVLNVINMDSVQHIKKLIEANNIVDYKTNRDVLIQRGTEAGKLWSSGYCERIDFLVGFYTKNTGWPWP